MKQYTKPNWCKKQIIRADGRVEDICEHGIGHPNAQWLLENDPAGSKMFSIHGCDGCCSKSIRDIREGKLK